MRKDYNIKVRPITTLNPWTNTIQEHVHQTIGNIKCTFKGQSMVLGDVNPWDGILAIIMFALPATLHTTTQLTHAQLVFGHDSIMDMCHKTNH